MGPGTQEVEIGWVCASGYRGPDPTKYATLRNWTLQISLVDIGYGALASGIAATVATLVTRKFAG
jgi:uncharacterized membrane protein